MGPTAVGKSALALRLAEEFGGEIVTADSRQVYRYMDIGTAKPTSEERARVSHYMIDLVEPSDVYSAGRFCEEGSRVLDRIAASGRLAIVSGGTGFYLRALLDRPLVPEVDPDPELRAMLRAEAAVIGSAGLHQRLAGRDSVSARRIHPNNLPRIIRALEIVERLGGPVPGSHVDDSRHYLLIGMRMDRDRLKQIADRRVLSQVEAGLVEETRLLLSMGYDPDSPALSGFGYRQMVAHLTKSVSLANAIRDYQTATRQYIRRQLTWFRADARITWVEAEGDPFATAARLVEQWCATGVSV